MQPPRVIFRADGDQSYVADVDDFRVEESSHPLPFGNMLRRLWGWSPMRGRHTGDRGPNAQFCAIQYSDGQWFVEVAVVNDSIRHPIGYRHGSMYVFSHGDDRVAQVDGVHLHDQTGCATTIGTAQWASHKKLSDWVGDEMPELEKEYPQWSVDKMAQRWPMPDPTRNTHQVGSPRNRYLSRFFSAHHYHPTNHSPATALHDFVMAQYGFRTPVPAADGSMWFEPGRPYHLTENGNVYDYERLYDVDGTGQYPLIGEGQPSRRSGDRDTFGRRALADSGSLGPGSPRNGYDVEHLEVEELFAAYVLLGSEFAKRDLLTIVNGLLHKEQEHAGWQRGVYHSSRTLWCLRAILRALQVSEEHRYYEVALAVADFCMSGDYAGVLRSDSKDRFPEKWILSRSNQKAYWHDGGGEACWQAAVACESFWLGARLAPKSDKERWVDWATYAAECISYCWDSPERGWHENYEIANRSLLSGDVTFVGTRSWVVQPMARSGLLKASYASMAGASWAQLENKIRGAWNVGGNGWTQWSATAAKILSDNHE